MKKLVFGLAAVMMCVSLAGCGGKAVDINELASALSSDGKFAEQLTEVSSDIAEKRFQTAKLKNVCHTQVHRRLLMKLQYLKHQIRNL